MDAFGEIPFPIASIWVAYNIGGRIDVGRQKEYSSGDLA